MPTAPRRFSLSKLPDRKAWANASKRTITGRALQRERERLFAEEPLCRECSRNGRTTAASIRDHIKGLAFGGKDERRNTQPLCDACHDEKTKRESAAGAADTRRQER